MESILTAMALLTSCAIGGFIGMVFVFAGVRSAGYILSYRHGRWHLLRRVGVRPPVSPSGTMRSLN